MIATLTVYLQYLLRVAPRAVTLATLAPLYLSTPSAKADVVFDWSNAAIAATRATPAASNPGDSTRIFAMFTTAMYDAVYCIDGRHLPYTDLEAAAPHCSKEAAASKAARDVLVQLFPAHTSSFDQLLAQHLAAVPDSVAREDGVRVGERSAVKIMALRASDGSQHASAYITSPGPGRWRPDPLHPGQQAWGPRWGEVKTWTGVDATTFRAIPPPALTSIAYAASLNQVKSLGALNSTTRTPDQTEIGIFWAYDRQQVGPPPLLFNQVVQKVAQLKGNTLEQNVLLFAMVHVAMADASIAAWDTKFAYDLWRPVAAVREADTDGNALTLGDASWVPLGAPGDPAVAGSDFTPPFPAYISGHATMGGATFRTLENFYGSDEIGGTLVVPSDELPGVTRSYTHFSQMDWENSISRVYLGVHFDFDSTIGSEVGRSIADTVKANMLLPTSTRRASQSLIPSQSLTLTQPFAGAGVRYQWLRNGIELQDSAGQVQGATTAKLNLLDFGAEDAGTYVCQLVYVPNDPDRLSNTAPVQAAAFSQQIAGAVPAKVEGLTLPGTVVAGRQLSLRPSNSASFQSFEVVGLPAGLSFDPATGAVVGTVKKAGEYRYRIRGVNAFGASEWTEVTVVVVAKAGAIAGAYAGLVGRLSPQDPGYGGLLQCNVSASGAVTGSVDVGTGRYAFSGALSFGPRSAATFQTIFYHKYLTIQLEWAEGTHEVTGYVAATNGSYVLPLGAKQLAPLSGIALPADWLGRHQVTIAQQEHVGNSSYPQGQAASALTLARTGRYSWAGRLPDGSAFTMAGRVTSAGSFPARTLLYSKQGSLQGWQQLVTNGLTGTLEWWKRPVPKAASYPLGFSLHSLSVSGD